LVGQSSDRRKEEMVERSILYEAHPALEHRAYSGMTLLPGEDAKQFRQLYEAPIAEFSPEGPFESAMAGASSCNLQRGGSVAKTVCGNQSQNDAVSALPERRPRRKFGRI
jgi:hypothetical protein